MNIFRRMKTVAALLFGVSAFTIQSSASEPTIVVFHDWIRTRALDEDVLVDVADYGHVKGGPGVLLVCHEGHYVIECRPPAS